MKLLRGQKIGTPSGRVWHLAAGVQAPVGPSGIYAEWTLCGKIVNERWRPGIHNRDPGVCRKCREENDG